MKGLNKLRGIKYCGKMLAKMRNSIGGKLMGVMLAGVVSATYAAPPSSIGAYMSGNPKVVVTWDKGECPRWPKSLYKPKSDKGPIPGIVKAYFGMGYGKVGYQGLLYEYLGKKGKKGKGLVCVGPIEGAIYGMIEDIEAIQEGKATVDSLLTVMDGFYREHAMKALLFLLTTSGNATGSFYHAYSREGFPYPLLGTEEGIDAIKTIISYLDGMSMRGDTVVWGNNTFALRNIFDVRRLAEKLGGEVILTHDDWAAMEEMVANGTFFSHYLVALQRVKEAELALKKCGRQESCYPYRDGVFDRVKDLLNDALKHVRKAREALSGGVEE